MRWTRRKSKKDTSTVVQLSLGVDLFSALVAVAKCEDAGIKVGLKNAGGFGVLPPKGVRPEQILLVLDSDIDRVRALIGDLDISPSGA